MKLRNAIKAEQCFLENAKLADVTLVYKWKDPNLVKNYKPFSALPSVLQKHERIFQKQISWHINDFLSPFLYGYRKGFSSQHYLESVCIWILSGPYGPEKSRYGYFLFSAICFFIIY